VREGYTWIFADERHDPIRDLRQLKRLGYCDANLGLFYNGVCVGQGSLLKVSWVKKHLHTDYVRLKEGFRRKGHGLHLYLALIECAKKLGAKRLYSSTNLNKHSSRVWRIKLEKQAGVKVHHVRLCSKPCKHCSKKQRHYIDL
jgi:GNAT superfamily N-acetyltransferase